MEIFLKGFGRMIGNMVMEKKNGLMMLSTKDITI
jgi:hypothetical protein